MNNSMNALPTWTSPPFDARCDRCLAGSVVPVEDITSGERERMYSLLATYFTGTRRDQFEADLAEKEAVVMLRDAKSGTIQGFSTFMRMAAPIDALNIVAFFSGDTIVAREYWGETILSQLWSRTVLAEADLILAQSPSTRVYWFLICSGYKTWRFLPVFFREYFPNPSRPTPPDIQRLLDTLGERKFGDQYLAGPGIVRFRRATPLRRGIADVTEQRLRDPRVAYFAHMNPGHAEGDELACLTEISRSNLTRAGDRMVGARLGHS
jgi:hypothetical protein